jgi:hypothetical protein
MVIKIRKPKLVLIKKKGKETRTKDTDKFRSTKSNKQMLTNLALCSIRK